MIYDAGITNASLITEVKSEADIAVTIPDDFYLRHLNTLYQMLYRNFINSESVTTIEDTFTLDDITVPSDEDNVQFDDILHLYLDGDEYYALEKVNATLATTYGSPCFYRGDDGDIVIVNDTTTTTYYLIRRPRPAILTSVADTNNVPLPYEFVQLAIAKLLGEMYKAANDDVLSAKWLGEYNTILEDFKTWIAARSV